MKSRLFVFVSLIIASFLLTPFLPAQDTDKDVDDAIQEGTESAIKMGVKMPDVKKQLEEVNKEEAKEKAALQKQLEAPGRSRFQIGLQRYRSSSRPAQFRGRL